MNAIAKFIKDDHGQDMAEYALVAALISVIAIASITAIRGSITTLWTNVQTALAGAV